MKSIYSQFEADKRLETDGITLDFGDGMKIRIARAGGGNQAYNARAMAAFKPYRRVLQLERMSDEQAREILIMVFAETVLKGWEGIRDRDGNELEFNRGNAIKVLTDLPDLFQTIRDEAEKVSNFLVAEVEEIVKN